MCDEHRFGYPTPPCLGGVGIGDKAAWKIVSTRANRLARNPEIQAFENISDVFDATDLQMPEFASLVMEVKN